MAGGARYCEYLIMDACRQGVYESITERPRQTEDSCTAANRTTANSMSSCGNGRQQEIPY